MRYTIYENPSTHQFAILKLPAQFLDGDRILVPSTVRRSRRPKSTIRFGAIVQVCESVQPRLAVSRYVDVCLNEMATEPGFERIEGAGSAAGNEFVR